MKDYCTVPMKIIKDENGDPKYEYCSKPVTHAVTNSLWYVCEAHANTMKEEGRWDLIPIEEVDDGKGYARRREGINGMEESERQTCSCGSEGGSCCQS